MNFCAKSFVCSHETVESLKIYSSLLEIFLTTYTWLSDAFVLDFFTEQHWEKLPKSWKEYLSQNELEHISRILSNKSCVRLKTVMPLSLQAFGKVSFILAWPRKAVTQDQLTVILSELTKASSFVHGDPAGIPFKEWKSGNDELSSTAGQHESLGHIYRRRVKPKKQHEIFRCAEVVCRICSACQCSHVVDIGSGQGHLSRYLGFQQGLNVISIEGNGCHVSGAQKLDCQTSTDLHKKESKSQQSNCCSVPSDRSFTSGWEPPKHVNFFISPEILSTDLLRVLNERLTGHTTAVSVQPKFTFLGLHTCGNLAPTMLRLYTETDDICALISVGCCYMKLNSAGFPMSKIISNLACKNLSYEAMEVSCHALEQYSARIKDCRNPLKIHCYRATLEVLIIKHYPEFRHLGLRSIKHLENMSFPESVSKALYKHSISIPDKECQSDYINSCLSQWKRVVIFYSLRLMVAPIIESLILLDRMFYLYEKGCSSCLVPVFEPTISARNHILVSVK